MRIQRLHAIDEMLQGFLRGIGWCGTRRAKHEECGESKASWRRSHD
jgi:hypothetical protein